MHFDFRYACFSSAFFLPFLILTALQSTPFNKYINYFPIGLGLFPIFLVYIIYYVFFHKKILKGNPEFNYVNRSYDKRIGIGCVLLAILLLIAEQMIGFAFIFVLSITAIFFLRSGLSTPRKYLK